MVATHQLGTGVQQHEVAGAVGVLGLAGGEADLPDRRRLLVTQVAGERHAAHRRAGHLAVPVGVGRRADLGEHAARDAEELQQFVVPVEGLEVHQHGAAGVGHVGDVRPAVDPAGEVPDQPGVGVSEDRVAALCRRAHAVHVVEDPLDLAAGEVGGRWQARLATDHLAVALPLQRAGDPVGARVLPDDRVVVRPAGAPVPDHRRLALVGDAQRGEVADGAAVPVHRGLDHRRGAFPDLDRVVLDPAGTRQDLFVLELVLAHLVAAVIEDHEAGAGGALVDGADEISHGRALLRGAELPGRERYESWMDTDSGIRSRPGCGLVPGPVRARRGSGRRGPGTAHRRRGRRAVDRRSGPRSTTRRTGRGTRCRIR